AARALERARARGVGPLDPVASYYAGLAWRRAKSEDEARTALRRVVDDDPDSPWADAAQRALGSAGVPAGRRRWLRVQPGGGCDSNVVHAGHGVELPSDIGHQSAAGSFWTAEGAAELLRRGPWTLGVHADYAGSVYADLHDFDLEYPGVGLWVDRWLSET